MDSLWPCLAMAGLAAGWGLLSRDTAQALRALLPIALGHVAALGVAVAVVTAGLSLDRVQWGAGAGILLAGAVVARRWSRAPAGQAGLALGAFIMSILHGAGLALVPALVPLCLGPQPDGASGPLWAALASAGLHLAVMLGGAALVAGGVCRGILGKPQAAFVDSGRAGSSCGQER